MKLLLIRHAVAEDRDEYQARTQGAPDSERPLLDIGRKKMRKAANRLRSQAPGIDLLASSALVRARETADIIARAYGELRILERNDLAPDSAPDSLLAWLREQPAAATVALVGHEPDLGRLAGLLLTGVPQSLLVLRKGGVALIDFSQPVAPGTGVLQWLLTSGQLRSLKD